MESVLGDISSGRSLRATTEFNKLLLSFVCKLKRKLEVSEPPSKFKPQRTFKDIGITRGKPVPHSDNVRTPEFVARVQQMVDQDPSKICFLLSQSALLQLSNFLLFYKYGSQFRRGVVHEKLTNIQKMTACLRYFPL